MDSDIKKKNQEILDMTKKANNIEMERKKLQE